MNGLKKDNGLTTRSALVVAAVSALLGGAGGPLLLVKFGYDPFRPDPFTGIQGALLSSRIERLEDHLQNHPDQTNRFDARLTALETRQSLILANQERILDRLQN